ncbi:MAG: phenylalanine--tRNA ligase subunit beta [Vicinamibacterales bacterium]
MKLLLSWAREFVDVSATPKQIADTMALRGFEVASIESIGDDAVIDFEITANRPDCLSVVGLAREIAAAFDLPFHEPSERVGALAPLETGSTPELTVSIEDEELCPRYAAAVAEVSAAQSPVWMTSRLQASGVRPISPLVDITNYVLLELGHPMHAFDLDLLGGRQIRVRRAAAGETMTTLDNVERKLDADMLVIADADRAQAVAGVMGGGHSEVSGKTRRVAFESAYFKPASVRRTSKRLGLKTEASSRFERGADVNAPVTALRRAVALLHQIGAGQLRGPAIDVYPAPRAPLSLHLRRSRLARLLGLDIPDADVVRILKALDLRPTATEDGWDVTAPTSRVDLLREIDLIEEVGRHYGFDKLQDAFPVMRQAASAPDPRVLRDGLLRRALTGAGLNEAVTFGFIESKTAEAFVVDALKDDIVAVANPLSAKFDVLRPSLLPGLMDAVAHNRRHGRRDVGLFEIGARFRKTEGETRGVAFAWTGPSSAEHWSTKPPDVDFFDAKGIVERVCDTLGIVPVFEVLTATVPFVPGQCAIVKVQDEIVGQVGVVQPSLVDRAGAPKQDRVVAGELNLDRIEQLRSAQLTRVRPLPRYPFMVRDVSVIVPDSLPAAIIRGTIQSASTGHAAPLVAVTFFDRYQGKGVPADAVSLSIRLTFQAPDRTLTDPEVQTAFDSILAALVREHAAVQR